MTVDRTAQARDGMRRLRAQRKAAALVAALRPREMQVVNAMLTGKTVNEALQVGHFNPDSGSMKARCRNGGDLHQTFLAVLDAEGATPQAIARTVTEGMMATQAVGVVNLSEPGKKECIERPDTDGRLKAAGLAYKMRQDAGGAPTRQQSTGSGSLSLVLQSLNVTLDLVDTHADNEEITS
jgi:hypothetical protein